MRQIFLPIVAAFIFSACNQTGQAPISQQKEIVETYMEGFRHTDHEKILNCLTDDVVWECPGLFSHTGKAAYDKEIENPNADGHPQITVTRMIEEGNIVIAEGTVVAKLKNAPPLHVAFCDVFHFTNGKISKLTSYLMFPPPQ